MWVLETVAVAFSMFSSLPMPQFEWRERTMRYALAAFPLIGAVQGLAWWGVCALSGALGLPVLLRGAILCALPAVVTGGIHLDGYADTSDALASHASPERKQEILRDPHCGAFAVIRLCTYFAVFFALCCSIGTSGPVLWCIGLGFVLSRVLSGLALTFLRVAEGSSLVKSFVQNADRLRVRVILLVWLAAVACALLRLGGIMGAAMLCAALLTLLRYAYTARNRFGGISGDLAGWFVVKAEFWMLAALVAVQYGERLL